MPLNEETKPNSSVQKSSAALNYSKFLLIANLQVNVSYCDFYRWNIGSVEIISISYSLYFVEKVLN